MATNLTSEGLARGVPPPWEGAGWIRGEVRRGAFRFSALFALVALIALATVLAGCRHAPSYPGAPIILISIDTLRSDHLPAYGYAGVETPALDALRRDAILCERAYSHYPMTLPSHASILTGLLPTQHGVRDNVGYPLDGDRYPTLARLLKAAGYETGGAVSTYVLRHTTGIAAGFDSYEDSIEVQGGERLDDVQRAGGETARRGLDWIRGRAAGKPFFFFLHLYEPHTPYTPPEPWKSRYRDHPYDGEIATADAIVGNFLDELKKLAIYDRAVVLLLSDHGEGLNDHGERQHGIFLYRETLQVPLLLKLPGGERKGATLAAPVELADVAPTLLALAGVKRPREMTGTPLLDLLDGKVPAREIYSETFYPRLHLGWSDLASLIGDRYHYIEGPDPELYDLAHDRGETVNLRDRERRTFAALRADIKPYDRALTPPHAANDQETMQKLASLGYLGGSAAVTRGALPDPKSQRQALAGLEEAFEHIQTGDDAGGVAAFRRLLAVNPRMADVWAFLAFSLQRMGRHAEASPAFEKALSLSNGTPSLAVAAAASLIALGRLDDARAHAELAMKGNPAGAYDILVQVALARHDDKGALDLMRRAVTSGVAGPGLRRRYVLLLAGQGDPQQAIAALKPLADRGDPEAIGALATALSDTGHHQEAAALLTQLLARQPGNARAHELQGMVALRLERLAEARGELERSLALDAKSASAWNTLGVALFRLEGPGPALAAWQKSVALDPTQYDALLNIGLVAAQAGRRAEASRALKQFLATAPSDRFGEDRQKARGLLQEIGG
ncbi:MAG TPA: sulfatase-like hydrolase/transferase [Thermoanaerobaculia bacterium]|nr:sulfatase-like hydrolase/transferase [Thermoanaerobaculia bacterium]